MRTNRLIIKENYRSILLISSCLFGIAGINPARVNAYCQLTTDSNEPGECVDTGRPLYWTCSNITYSVCPRDVGTPPFTEITTVIEDSFQTWADVECSEGPIGFEFIRKNNPKECDDHWKFKEDPNLDFSPNENLIIFVPDWNDYYPREPKAFALTSVWHKVKTGIIQGFDMELNEDIGTFGICNRAKMRSCDDIVDIQNVVTHEIGHIVGLGHSSVESAVMFKNSQTGDTSKREPKKDDIKGLCSVYEDNLPTYCSASTRTKSTSGLFSCRTTHGRNPDEWIPFVLSVSILLVYRRRRDRRSERHL
jgi:hypothetical protein